MLKSSIYIKNMVCPRCITAVQQTLNEQKIPFSEVKLGEAVLETANFDYQQLDKKLKEIGFELIQDKSRQTVEQIKSLIVNFIHHNSEEDLKINFSEYLANKTGFNYSYISTVFSEIENTTIEKFIILQKIAKVKELISYNELNFSEIAIRLNYSSASHLSKQFKNITGYSLSEYKKTKTEQRKSIDKLL